MRWPVRTTPQADAQIRDIDRWWRVHRTAAPELFLDELTAVFDTIGQAPQLGRPYRLASVPGVRRVLLNGTRHHVYYVPSVDYVTVLAVWHAQRGVGPPLR